MSDRRNKCDNLSKIYGWSIEETKLAMRKFRAFKCRVKRSNMSLQFGFDEYAKKIIEADILPSDIGRGLKQYCIGRHGDTGDYEVDTCRFITTEQNISEEALNGGTTSSAIKRSGRYRSNGERNPTSSKISKWYKLIHPCGKVEFIFNLNEYFDKPNRPVGKRVKDTLNTHKPNRKGYQLYHSSEDEAEAYES